MYDQEAEAAVRFYAATFPNTILQHVHRIPGSDPTDPSDAALLVDFTLLGMPAIAVNGGPHFAHSEAFSIQVATDTQEETDRYWHAIVGHGGSENICGWCKDKWGISWQITPRTLTEGLAAGGVEAARVFDAMMAMKKIDIVAIDAARKGPSGSDLVQD